MNFLKTFLIGLLVTCFISISFFAFYFYQKYQKSLNKEQIAVQEVQELKAAVNKLIVLPDEDPVVATITDKTKLEQQAFFKQAENGDKVLIFQKSSKAILYRPSQQKIVDVTVLNVTKPTESSPTPTPTKSSDISPATITIYNGSLVAGLTGKVESKIIKDVSDIKVLSKVNAAKSDYQKTMVIDLSKKYSDKANEIDSNLGAELASLPEGEFPVSTDILIIAASDQQ